MVNLISGTIVYAFLDKLPSNFNKKFICNPWFKLYWSKSKGQQNFSGIGVNGVNTRMGESWSYSETNHFHFNKDNINLINKEKSEVKREKFDTGE